MLLLEMLDVQNIYMLENSDNMLKALNFVNLSEVAIQTANGFGGIMDAVGNQINYIVLL